MEQEQLKRYDRLIAKYDHLIACHDAVLDSIAVMLIILFLLSTGIIIWGLL